MSLSYYVIFSPVVFVFVLFFICCYFLFVCLFFVKFCKVSRLHIRQEFRSLWEYYSRWPMSRSHHITTKLREAAQTLYSQRPVCPVSDRLPWHCYPFCKFPRKLRRQKSSVCSWMSTKKSMYPALPLSKQISLLPYQLEDNRFCLL